MEKAIRQYAELISSIRPEGRPAIGLVGDAQFQSARFYHLTSLDGSLSFDRAEEFNAAEVDQIEESILESGEQFSLMATLLAQLEQVAGEINDAGSTLFLASWGMGPAEIGWFVRRLNRRERFTKYLADARVSEAEIDLLSESLELDIAESTIGSP